MVFTDVLKNCVIYRSITGIGRVEDKIQLGTMFREITHLVGLAKVNNPSLELEPNLAFVVHQYIYQLSKIGYFRRNEKPQAIFGLPEVLIIINNCLKEASISGSIIFEFQHKDAKYMQWKHVQIWTQGRDDRGYKINVVIQLPHLKGRGKYFSESNRTFKKTFTSAVIDGVDYERNGDFALFICALAFRRNIPIPNSPEEWYQGNLALLEIKEDRLEEPVFINSLFIEEVSPWTSDSAEHTTSRRIANFGLNISSTLYSFRRNFAQIINDNLSNGTASTLTGHTPASYTLKKSYAGTFERLDITTLVTTGEAAQGHTVDPLLRPAMFHIKDISRYKLTVEEISDGIDGDEKVTNLFNARADFIKELIKKYGSASRDNWTDEEIKDLLKHNRLYKQARRVVTVRLTREKFQRLYEMAPRFLEVDENGTAILNENAIDLPKRPDPTLPEQHANAEDDDSDNQEGKSDDEAGNDDDEAGDDDDNEAGDNDDKIFDGEEYWAPINEGEDVDDEGEEIEYKEDQVSDQLNSSQEKIEGPPGEPELPEAERIINRNENLRLQDLLNLVSMRSRPTGKSMCQWCLQDGFESQEYQV
ncbi:uncharacterized protein EV154DRAFT_566511 [Mucor mucedo]|uniref:uncharacterized protein n=1 Tax=Mucor mucedo TaxID=29922 RepID=UPI002220C46F|nr:uncharacterized protein EV154DRAFT_566511 [Mucor mucedo]KAI7888266.1 hypothetical protein EV154DRAFT_566511 [Mucor mucedo]